MKTLEFFEELRDSWSSCKSETQERFICLDCNEVMNYPPWAKICPYCISRKVKKMTLE